MKTMLQRIFDVPKNSHFVFCSAVLLSCLLSLAADAQDAVFKFKAGGGNSKDSGRITEISPEGVTIDGELVPAESIKKVVFSKEPSEIGRARDQMEAGRFADCLEELDKIGDTTLSKRIRQEIDFLRAYSTSQIALRIGTITPQAAGKEVGTFIQEHGDSYHLYPMVEQYGKLIWAFGKPDLAVAEFEKLANCSWLEYRLKGDFYRGQALLELGKYAEAQAAFDAILATQSNDDISQAFRLYAKCEKARAIGLAGNTDEARKTIEEIIRDENPDNKRLFAYLYNALGSVYEKSGQIKEAARAYLHTELLFATESEPHAEALYRLALIWPQLEQTDRANRARDTLKSRYRNSYWAGKL